MLETGKLKNIPSELKMNGLWCCWKKVKKDDKYTKVPYDARTGQMAKPNDSSTFCTYPELLHNCINYSGVGLGIFKGYSAVDIDHCVDENGEISELARDIIDYCNSYTELSPSGTGIRIIFKAPDDWKLDKDKYYTKNSSIHLEIYCSEQTNKYVTITGNTLGINTEISEVNIETIFDKYMKRNNFSISDIIEKDSKFKELWNKQAPGSGSNESELDSALCCKLAYYLHNDKGLIEQYFVQSPYYQSKDAEHKKKWTRTDYRTSTIDNAIKFTVKTVEQNQIANQYVELGFNDTTNARRFINMFSSNIRYNLDNKCWMIWNGKYWQNDYSNDIRNLVCLLSEDMRTQAFKISDEDKRRECLKAADRILNKGGKDALLAEAQSLPGIPTVNDDYDKDEWLLNCQNGVVNLKTCELFPHDKTQMLSQCTKVEVDLEHEPQQFIKFINEIFEGKQDLIDYVHKWLGYACSGSAKEQKMCMFLGDGRNGKSLLLELVGDILGDYSITSRPTLLTEQFNGNSSLGQIARLKGKRFVYCEELKMGDRIDESILKSLTSGIGNIIGKFLYANEFEFLFKGKISMSTNHLPLIRGTDNGIWRRIIVVPFNKTFDDTTDNKNLKEELLNESSQILGWLVKGCKKYIDEGLTMTQEVLDATSAYKKDSDLVQQWIDECCECSPDYYEKAGVLFENFKSWCFKGEFKSFNITVFGKNLAKKFERKQFSYGKVYYGIRIKREYSNLDRDVKFERIKITSDI